MTKQTAFEKWWHEKCEHDLTFPNESSFISGIAKQAWNAAIDAAMQTCREVYAWEFDTDSGEECEKQIAKLRSE